MDTLLQTEFIQTAGPAITLAAALTGIWLVLTAVTVPGTGVPEIGAAISLLLAAAGMFALEAYLPGVILLVAALGVFVAFIFYRHVWLLPIVGFVLQALGSFFLFQADRHPSLGLILLINTVSLVYYALIVRPGLRIQDRADAVGGDPLIGARGQVTSTLDPEGTIRIEGAVWRARASKVVPGGAWVQVVARDGLELQVIPAEPEPLAEIIVAR